MQKKIDKLRQHYIICGAGRVGAHVVDTMLQSKQHFVIVEKDEQVMSENPRLENNPKILSVFGDATKEEILKQAGVERAKGLVSCVRDDAVNLFICLTAKKLNPHITISSYVLDEVNIRKFYHVGVDEVVSGDFVIGERLALSLLNKNILGFLEQTNNIGHSGEQFFVGDVTVSQKSPFNGKTLRETDIARKLGLLIFAIRKSGSKEYSFNPESSLLLSPGDTLITFGSRNDLRELEKYVNP